MCCLCVLCVVYVFVCVVYVFYVFSMYFYVFSMYSMCCLCILCVVYVFYVFSMYSVCCLCVVYVFLCVVYVFLDAATLTEVFPCFFLSCKANTRVWLAKTGHGPHSPKLLCCSMYCLFCVVLCTVCV